MSAQAEWLADLADTAADLGMAISAISPKTVTLFSGGDTVITIESHFLSGRMLRSVLRPREDPATAENSAPRHPFTCAYCTVPPRPEWDKRADYVAHMAASHPGLPYERPLVGAAR